MVAANKDAGVLLKTAALGLCILTVLACGVALTRSSGSPNDRQVAVILRYDDYSDASNTPLEKKILQTCRRYGVPITVSVIPFSAGPIDGSGLSGSPVALSKHKSAMLREAMKVGDIDVAQHGFTHNEKKSFLDGKPLPVGSLTEFVGFGYGDQFEKILRGRLVLEKAVQRPVNVFVPPWNTYDLNTVRALEAQGFDCLSGSLSTDACTTRLKMLPCVTDLKRLEASIGHARQLQDPAPVLVCLFHGYDFREDNPELGITDYPTFDALVKRLASDKSIKLMSLSQASTSIRDDGAERYAMCRHLWNSAPAMLIPAQLRFAPSDVYPSRAGVEALEKTYWMLAATYYVFVVLVGMFVGSILFGLARRLHIRQDTPLVFGLGFLASAVGLLLVERSAVGYSFLTVLAAIVGVLLAGSIGWLAAGRNRAKELSE